MVCIKHNKLIRAGATVRGFFVLDGVVTKNKITRNMGYAVDGLLRRVDVSVYDEGGASRTLRTSSGGFLYGVASGSTTAQYMGPTLFFHFGGGTTTPTVTDNNLATALEHTPTNYIDTVESDTDTRFIVAARWAPDADRGYSEVALKLFVSAYDNWATMLARAVVSPVLVRNAYTEYFDAYVLSFPASVTRWFVRALACAAVGHQRRPTRCLPVVADDGSLFVVRSGDTFTGTLDLRFGSDNTPPSPTDNNLRAPIGSLASQTQTVEVDTTAQEVRVVRCGSTTPSANLTLGEIGLFASLYGFAGGSSVTKTIMVGRVALPSTQTLFAGITYTLCFVLRLV